MNTSILRIYASHVRMTFVAPLLAIGLALSLLPCSVQAVDHVVLERKGVELHVTGKVLSEARDGGLLVLDRQGVLWQVLPEELKKRVTDDEAFVAISKDEMAEEMLTTLPAGFRSYTTGHYIICHNTSDAYAKWTGSLFERLYRAFRNYWERKGYELHDAELPMVVLVFDSKESYVRYASTEIGDASDDIIGYYNLLTNRVLMYDLTGVQANSSRRRGSNSAEINRILRQPAASALVATVVHEATHQIAFNCGLQTRLSDTPYWLSEGIAMYFETPDLSSSKGWRGLGSINRGRLNQFRRHLSAREEDSLSTLLGSDSRHRDPDDAPHAYAESWALVYYLIHRKPKEFRAYMNMMANKKPLFWKTPEERLEQFQDHFGDLEAFDEQFIRHMRRVR